MVSTEGAAINPALQTHPTRILDLWRALGLTDDTLAAALDVDPRALSRWSRGMYPQLATRGRLVFLEQLHAHLRETFVDDDAIRQWLDADSRYLGGLKPADALRAGRIDRVEAAVTALDSGAFVQHDAPGMTPPDEWNPVAAIAACRLTPFVGAAWRAHGPRYEATSQEGSRRTTGRYNCGPDRFPLGPNWPVLYLALARDVCIGELVRNVAPLAPSRLNHYRISELHVTLSVVVDCTDLTALRLDIEDLCHDSDWEIPQELAEVALHARYEAMIVPAASRLGTNLIIFPEQLRPGSTIEVRGYVEPQLYRG